MKPFMPQKEIELFYKYLDNCKYYLEYGSGGSTIQALNRNNVKVVVSVESDKQWYNKIKKNTINSKKIYYHYIELHSIPNNLGYPQNASIIEMKRYPSVINYYKLNFDLILIDGRFRVACALLCFSKINNNCIVIIDDIGNRPHYNIIYNYYNVIEKTNRMAVLKKKSVLNPSIDIINKYISDPR